VTSYRVELTPTAKKELDQLPKKTAQRILQAIRRLVDEPRPRGCKKLAGQNNAYRIRVGDYRVIYAVFDESITVFVVRIRHRKDAY
jgi:mRNA interferase RelE/StbE